VNIVALLESRVVLIFLRRVYSVVLDGPRRIKIRTLSLFGVFFLRPR